MQTPEAGYREQSHTADWELEVWAQEFPGLLEQAAHGMLSLMGVRLEAGPRQTRRLLVEGQDLEMLLVSFLQELLFMVEMEGLGVEQLQLQHRPGQVEAHASLAPIAAQSKEIKAVTYHNLSVRQTPHGLRANIVFDV